jgi:hypothetical protein
VKVSSGVSYLDRAVFLNLLCAEMLDKRKEAAVEIYLFRPEKMCHIVGSRDRHLELLAAHQAGGARPGDLTLISSNSASFPNNVPA